jgi:cytochrome c oxidase subunit 2
MAATGGGLVPTASVVLAGGGGIRAPSEIFQQIFTFFLALGGLVGVVVIGYTLYNAYKYRYREEDPAPDTERPQLGELPSGGGKGRKLFLSFAISALIVLSLILWTYGWLRYVEAKPTEVQQQGGDVLEIGVEGYQFGWRFHYPNGYDTTNTLRVPEDRVVRLRVWSSDVFHNFGIPEFRVKSDAIPGQNTTTWFVAKETGDYAAQCYELCGQGHSYMTADVKVLTQSDYQAWYNGTQQPANASTNGTKASVAG